MAATGDRPLETGWLPDTPVDDSLLRRFLHNQAEVNSLTAIATGGRAERTDDVVLANTTGPIPFVNQAMLTRPVLDAGDPVLDDVDAFFGGTGRPATLLSMWPTPDLRSRGWELEGHPMLVVRAPAPVPAGGTTAPGVDVRIATTADDFATAEQLAIDGFGMEVARGLPAGHLIPPGVADGGMVVRLGLLDGEPVGLGNVSVGHGVVNLCLAATLPAARRRGVWQALVWSRVAEAPDLPAVAYTSDDSRPGFIRMGFLPFMRFTLWIRPSG